MFFVVPDCQYSYVGIEHYTSSGTGVLPRRVDIVRNVTLDYTERYTSNGTRPYIRATMFRVPPMRDELVRRLVHL